MLLQYASDLHLEFSENKAYWKANPFQPVGDVLILAGDVMPFYGIDKHKDFFSYLSNNFAQTYWLPGNHEYYHGDAAQRSGSFQEKIRSNVFLLNDTTVQQDDVKLVFSTLWTNVSPAHEWEIERSMNDFQVIRWGQPFFFS